MMMRRDFLRSAALGLAAAPIAGACAEAALDPGDSGASDTGVADAGTTDAGTTDVGTTTDAGTAVAWASGGTAAMVAKASYPDVFDEAPSACAIVASTTEGPCTTAIELMREDVSEGAGGLPVRIALKFVDTSCNPLAAATVKIWHTNIEGSYSGQTPNNGMCLKQQSYSSMDFFRGAQTTDADGVVYFDSCFPGWYRGRAIHIHFQVVRGGVTTRVSQLFFPEDVTSEIFAEHVDYKSYGQPDTVFSNDGVISAIAAGDRARHVFAVQRMSDGAMLASKVVTVA